MEARDYGFAFRFVGTYAAFLGVVQASCIILGVLRVSLSQPIAVAIAAIAAAASVVHHRSLGRSLPAPAAHTKRRVSPASLFAIATLTTAGAIYLCSWIAGLEKPDMSFDGNSYHIPTIHFWTRRGYIHWIEQADPGLLWKWILNWLFNGYPKGVEATSFFATRLFASSKPVNTVNLMFLPLGAAGIACLSRSFGASRKSALVASGAFALTPLGVSQGVTTYVDASFADCVVALASAIVVVVPRVARGTVPFRALITLGSTAGLAAAAKSTGLLAAILAFLLVGAAAANAWRSSPQPSRRRWARQAALFLCGSGVVAVTIAGHWYFRSWVHTDNPVHPVAVSLFGHTLFPGFPLSTAVSEEGVTPPSMMRWPGWVKLIHTWTQGYFHQRWPGSVVYCDAREGGLGYIWLFGCIPAIVWAVTRSVRRRVHLDRLLPLVVFVGVLFLATPLNWWSRYTFWILGLGLSMFATAIDHVESARSWVTRAVGTAWVLGCLSFSHFEGIYAFLHSHALSPGFLDRPPRRIINSPGRFFLALVDYDHDSWFFGLPEPDVEVFTHDEGVALGNLAVPAGPLAGMASMPLGRRNLAFMSEDVANDAARVLAFADTYGVRYVYWRSDEPAPAGLSSVSRRTTMTTGRWWLFDLGLRGPTVARPLVPK